MPSPQAALLLLLSRRLSLERVGHEASVGSLGDKGMPRSHNLKAQKAEGSEQGGSVLAVLVEANEDMVGSQLLLSEFQENCKAAARVSVLASPTRPPTSWALAATLKPALLQGPPGAQIVLWVGPS